jgi:hypothetical protein
MDETSEPITPEELEEQTPELLPDREAMTIVNPLPQPIGDDEIYAIDPIHPHGA